MKREKYVISALLFCTIMNCNNTNNNTLITFTYTCPVYFAGYINGDYDSLTGNYWYRNSCKLVGDTIRIMLYSSGFEETNRVRHGDFIRLDLYPGNDSAVGRSRVFFHMARYLEHNISYTISAIDTLYGFDRIQIHVQDINRTKGGYVDLEDISVLSRPISGTNGEELKILHGHLKGTIR